MAAELEVGHTQGVHSSYDPSTVPDVPKLDHVATLKLSAAQLRRCKAAARAQGLRFSVWARNVLVSQANRTVGQSGSGMLDAPKIPG
jgi:hypothetical protein